MKNKEEPLWVERYNSKVFEVSHKRMKEILAASNVVTKEEVDKILALTEHFKSSNDTPVIPEKGKICGQTCGCKDSIECQFSTPVIEQKEYNLKKIIYKKFEGLSNKEVSLIIECMKEYAESKQLTPTLDASQFNSGDRVNHFLVNAIRQLTNDEIRILAGALLDRIPKPPQQ